MCAAHSKPQQRERQRERGSFRCSPLKARLQVVQRSSYLKAKGWVKSCESRQTLGTHSLGGDVTPNTPNPRCCFSLWKGQSRFQPGPLKRFSPLARWQGLCQRQKAPWDTFRVCLSGSLHRASSPVGVLPRLLPSPSAACFPSLAQSLRCTTSLQII